MPQPPAQQRRQQPARPPQQAVAAAAAPPATVQPPQDRALQALSHEIDNRLEIVRVSAAAGITPERLKAVALSTFTRTPALWACTPISIARAIVEAGQLGLEPTGTMGGAYLVPYWNKNTGATEAQLIVGYRGLVILTRRSGEIARVEARVVHANDDFDYEYGLDSYLHHKPARMGDDPGKVAGAYAVAFYRDGNRQFDVMDVAEIDAIRRRSKAADSGPWVTDYEEMAKKTPLRRLTKLLPMALELATALDEIDPEVVAQVPPSQGSVAASRTSQARQAVRQRLAGTGGEVLEGQAVEVAADQQPAGQQLGAFQEEPPPPPAPPAAAAPAPAPAPAAAPAAPAPAQRQPRAAAAAPAPAAAPAVCGAAVPMGAGQPCQEPPGHGQASPPTPHRSEWGVWPASI